MSDVMVYVGRDRRCGCIYMATVDDNRADRRKTIVEYISEAIMAGDVVERMTLDAYRAVGFGTCDVCKPPEQEALPL